MHHHFRDQMYLPNTRLITKMITLFQIIIHRSHRCFHYHIYVPDKFFSTCFLPQHLRILQSHFITTTMNAAEYWPMAREYGIWNAAIESLQFWAEDLDPITLGIASECVYTHFFWTSTSHTLHQLSDEVLFGCFILALNSAFHQQLSFMQMKAMKVVLMKTYQHLYGKLLTYTMCPVWSMHLLTPFTLHHIDHLISLALTPSHLQSDQFADVYPSIVTRIKTPPWYAWRPPVPEIKTPPCYA